MSGLVAGLRPPTFNFVFKKQSDWQWIGGHIGYFWSLSRTHLEISLVAVLIGLVLAVPVGVVTVRVRGLYPPVLGASTLVYSLPSLALFAVLVGVTGLSNWTVIIPLTAYAVALLVRNVVDGLNAVPDEVRIAATAMGYRPLRRLVSVELPAAVPVIVAGLRVATVSSISLATVGSLVGVGGLGVLFTEGLNNNFITEILCGVVLVAFWALVIDGLILLAGRQLTPWARRSR